MATIGELATLITARTAPFSKGLKTAGKDANSFASNIKNKVGGAFGGLNKMLGLTVAGIASVGSAMAAGGLVLKAVKLASAAEDMETAYATYLKSMVKAKEVLKELQAYSGATPFEAMEIKEAGKQLLAFGFQASNLMTVIKVIGDLSAGSQKPMADFVDILGKVKASGVASMGDINRLADRGVPIFQELAKVMGAATSEVRTLVGTGKVGFEEVWEALNRVTKEGGLFEGAVAKMAETSSGKMSSLKDSIDSVFTDVGKAILDGLDVKSLTEKLTELVKTYKGDIVKATQAGVELIMAALERGPQWFNKIESAWQSLKWGSARISQYGQLVMPSQAVLDYYVGHRNPIDAWKWKNSIARDSLNRYNTLQEQAVSLEGRRRSLETAKPTEPERQQHKTLVDIYEEHRRANQLHERELMLMQQQRQTVVSHF